MGGNSNSALYKPINEGDVDALRDTLVRFDFAVPLLLKKQFDISNRFDMNPVFTTPLHFCIIRDQPECLKALLEVGGDPLERGKSGGTLLQTACKRNSVKCVQILLESGADAHHCDEWGVYPIHICAGCHGNDADSIKILEMLLEAGDSSDVNLKDSQYGKTPLHYAAYYGNKTMCGKLVELGAEIDMKDRTGRTPYQSAGRQKSTQDFLRECGADASGGDLQHVQRPYPTSPFVS